MKSRRWIYLALILAAVVAWRFNAGSSDGARAAQRAFEGHASGFVLTVLGEVERILDDDLRPPRHQRFIIRTSRGQTLLVSHNVDLAPRAPVAVGDEVTVRGEYEWNDKGGLLHNTHSRPRGGAVGWIRLERSGRLYR